MAPRARALLIVLFALTAPAAVHAQAPPRARLVYFVDPTAVGCPTPEELRAAVNARAGRELFGEPAARTLDVTIRRRDGAYEATVELPDETGAAKRELRSDVGCAELATAVALVASIALDPESILRPPPPPPPPPSPSSRAPAAPASWRAFVGLGPRAAWGLTPEITPGLALSGAARASGRFALGAEIAGFVPGDRAFSRGSISVMPLAFAVLPCGMTSHLELCAIARLGVLRGAGAGFAQDFATWKAFGAAGLRVGAFKDLGRLRLRASAEATGVAPVTHFLVDETSAYATRGVAFAAGLDALVLFP